MAPRKIILHVKITLIPLFMAMFLLMDGSTPAVMAHKSEISRPVFWKEQNKALVEHKQLELLQEWKVNATEVRKNEIITVNRLTVDNNVSLTLANCTLMINSTLENRGKIQISGTLILHNQTTIRAVNASIGYRFYFSSTSTFTASDSTIQDVGIYSKYAEYRDQGIHLRSKQTILRSTNITHCWNGLVIATKNSVKVEGCRITGCAMAGVWIVEDGGNVILENSEIGWNGAGVTIEHSSGNNTIRNNKIASNYQYGVVDYSYGVGVFRSNNNTIFGNRLGDERIGIFLSLSDDNRIEQNEIVTSAQGSGMFLEAGSSGNLLLQNIIHYARIGIEMTKASPNSVIANQFIDTHEVAILVDTCKQGDSISSNKLTVSSGIAMEIKDSSLARVENNTINASFGTNPAIYIVDSDNCSFIANQIATEGPVFRLLASSNIFLSENVVVSTSAIFLFGDSQSMNITFALFDPVNTTSLNLGSTLKLLPNAAVKSEIVSMTLHVNERVLSHVDTPNLELYLNTTEIGRGTFAIAVNIVFLNGTEASWSFSLVIEGRPVVSTTTSKASWRVLMPLLLGLLSLKAWILKRRREKQDI
ncbi:MAG: right-handed parallel beta-helix repeat-containing protein [Candidatus Hodarchaeales archaeon]|jgi:parallel beta-helix repeat protein